MSHNPLELPEDVKEEIRDLYNEGLTPANIRRFLGFDLHRIRRVLFPEAKAAHVAAINRWKEKNKERAREIQKRASAAWIKRNPGVIKTKSKSYYLRHQEALKAKYRKYYAEHKESLQAQNKANYQKRKLSPSSHLPSQATGV